MKRASATLLALLCAACGGSSDAPQEPSAPSAAAATGQASGQENGPPTIESAVITPNPAGSADALSLEIHAKDPDRDRLRTTVEWYRNGELVGDLHDPIAPAGSFARGDRVYAIVYVADAAHEVTAQTAALTIGNSAPTIRNLAVTPNKATSADLLEAQANVSDSDNDAVQVTYRWHKNGEIVPAATSARLAPGTLHRGDKVYVEASAADGTDASAWVSSPVVEILNAPPAISSQPGYEMGHNNVYSYDIAAKDPDDDQPLRYELVQGPKGMVVEETTGKLSWQVPQDAHGNSPIEIAVSDAYGGRVTQSWVLSIDWSQAAQPPASATSEDENGGGKKKAAAKAKKSDEEQGAEELDEEMPPKKASAKAQPAASGDQAQPKAAAKKKPSPASDDEPYQDEGEPAHNED
jgi:putative Ig domain-containing protein